VATANELVAFDAPVDREIRYPCYKSLDDMIDVERLKSLDGYIRDRIVRHIEADTGTYFQSDHRLDAASPYEPGVREIWLSRNKADVEYDYLNLNAPEAWERSLEADEFPLLMEFLATLPFKTTGRMLIIYDDAGNAVPAHRDHLNPELCHEFVWLRTNKTKPFFMLNQHTGEKLYVESHSAWFDTVNQFHGTDGTQGLSFSIRVDGVFTDELNRRIPAARCNRAARAALWACRAEAVPATVCVVR
jgi:hypothetical protein